MLNMLYFRQPRYQSFRSLASYPAFRLHCLILHMSFWQCEQIKLVEEEGLWCALIHEMYGRIN